MDLKNCIDKELVQGKQNWLSSTHQNLQGLERHAKVNFYLVRLDWAITWVGPASQPIGQAGVQAQHAVLMAVLHLRHVTVGVPYTPYTPLVTFHWTIWLVPQCLRQSSNNEQVPLSGLKYKIKTKTMIKTLSFTLLFRLLL